MSTIRKMTAVHWLGLLLAAGLVGYVAVQTSLVRAATGNMNIQGDWELEWTVDTAAPNACAGVTGAFNSRYYVSHTDAETGDVEFFTAGDSTDNINGPSAALVGDFANPGGADPYAFDVTGTYLNRVETINATLNGTNDGFDEAATTRTVQFLDQGCTVTYDLTGQNELAQVDVVTYCATNVDGCDYVATNEDESLQYVINMAEEGDIIKIAGGTYVSTTNTADPGVPGDMLQVGYISKTLTIRGGYDPTDWAVPNPAANPTILNPEEDVARGLYVTGTYSETGVYTPTRTVITGLEVTDGNAAGLDVPNEDVGGGREPYSMGGGIYVYSSTVSIIDSNVHDNQSLAPEGEIDNGRAGYGGGIATVDSNVVVRDSTIANNTSQDGGGIMAYYSHRLMLYNNTIANNHSTIEAADNPDVTNEEYGYGGGAALFWNQGNVSVQDNDFTGNIAEHHGGGLLIPFTWGESPANPALVTVSDNLFSNNTTSSESGGIGGGGLIDSAQPEAAAQSMQGLGNLNSRFIFARNQVIGNTADYGAGFAFERSVGGVQNNIFAQNTSTTQNGGGMLVEAARVGIVNNTVADNQGSGIYLVNWNVDLSPGQVPLTGLETARAGITNTILAGNNVGINVSTDNGEGSGAAMYNTLFGVGDSSNGVDRQGAIGRNTEYYGDPAFIDPDSDNYHIGPSSAALNRGASGTLVPTTDIDRDTRPQGTGYDIGADETTLTDTPNDITGLWQFRWVVDGERSNCAGVPDGYELTYRIFIDQNGNQVELFTSGYDNLPNPTDAVALPGEYANGTFAVSAQYFRNQEDLKITAPQDGRIDWGVVQVNYFDWYGAGACTIVSDLDPDNTYRIGNAPVRTVCSDAEACNYTTIQDALDAAAAGDMIKVAGGTYSTMNTQGDTDQIASIDQEIILRGGYSTDNWAVPDPAANPTILDPQGQGRAISIQGGAQTVFTDLTIQNGNGAGQGGQGINITGGGIYGNGGGIYCNQSSIALIGSTIQNNHALAPASELTQSNLGFGGGVGMNLCGGVVRDNAFRSNSANDGGGMYAALSVGLRFSNNVFDSNAALDTASDNETIVNEETGHGGGLTALLNNAPVEFNDNIVTNNLSDLNGGGVLIPIMNGNTLSFQRNTIMNNTAETIGGGGVIDGGSPNSTSRAPVTFRDNTIMDNTGSYGGGFTIARSAADVYNNMVAGNSSSEEGSGILIEGSNANIWYNTFASNNGGVGRSVEVIRFNYELAGQTGDEMPGSASLRNNIIVDSIEGVHVQDGSTIDVDYSLWGDGDWANEVNITGEGTIIEGDNNTTGNPDFVNTDGDNYHINPTSDAVDAAIDMGVVTDYDRQTRPIGSGFDIGADEAALTADGDAPDLNGEWDLYWNIDGSQTTCAGVPDGFAVRVRAIVSQEGDDIELFTAGYNNSDPSMPAVALTGAFARPLNGVFSAEASYLGDHETVTMASSGDNLISAGLLTVDYDDWWGTGSCTLVGTLTKAERLGNEPIYTVCGDASCDFNTAIPQITIQTAINSTPDGAMIKIAEGEYTTVGTINDTDQIAYIDNDLILRGGYTMDNWVIPDPAVYTTTLNPAGAGRAINIQGTEDTMPHVVVTGLHITGGDAEGQGGSITPFPGAPETPEDGIGGGIFAYRAALSVIDSVLETNSSTASNERLVAGQGGYGGAIGSVLSALTVRDSTLSSNEAQDGGAIYSNSAVSLTSSSYTVIVHNNTVANNTSYSEDEPENPNNPDYGYGAGMTLFINQGMVQVEHNTVADNIGHKHGGGVLIPISFGPVTVKNNVITGNESIGTGGGLTVDAPAAGATVSNNIFGNNSSGYGGGASLAQGNYTLDNNIFYGNTASHYAAGLFVESSAASLRNNTVVNHNGAGIYAGLFIEEHLPDGAEMPGPSSVVMTNTLLAGNLVGVEVEDESEPGADDASAASLNTTLWYTNTTDVEGTAVTSATNVTGDPVFVNAAANDYHLADGSYAIDMGAEAGLTSDIDGDVRPIGKHTDIGADESHARGAYTAPDTAGKWELNWSVIGDRTTCPDVPDATPVQIIAYISQQNNELEFFTTGIENTPTSEAISLLGGFALPVDGSFSVSSKYLYESEVIDGVSTSDGIISTATVTVTYHQSGCQIVSELVSANRLGDASATTVCPSGECDHTSVADAVASAETGDMIKVAAGTYTMSDTVGLQSADLSQTVQDMVVISQSLVLRGGYTTDNWNIPDTENNVATLDAQGAGRVIRVTGGVTNVIVDGLRIANGSLESDTGAGIYVEDTNGPITLMNNEFANNSTGGNGGGLAWYDCYTKMVVRDNTFTGNEAANGAGLYAKVDHMSMPCSVARIDHNTFTGNTATAQGGGGVFDGNSSMDTEAMLTRNTMLSNTAADGGGFALLGTKADVSNNIVAKNTSTTTTGGAGLYTEWATLTLLFNTVADNDGSGLLLSYSDVGITNTIVASNTVGVNVLTATNMVDLHTTLWGSDEAENGDNLIINGTAMTVTDDLSGYNVTTDGNISGDPAFVDAANNDYHITKGSTATDRGVRVSTMLADIDNDSRPNGGFDIGADEVMFEHTVVYLPITVVTSATR